jgi:hypothetical protein
MRLECRVGGGVGGGRGTHPRAKSCDKYCMHGQLNGSQGKSGSSVDAAELLTSISQAAEIETR